MRRLLLSAAIALAGTHCASTYAPELDQSVSGHLTPDQLRTHVLMFDSLGRMREPILDDRAPQNIPRSGFAILDTNASRKYVEKMIEAIRERKQRGPLRLLFFFHGGLNSRGQAIERAAKDIQQIAHDEPDIYPIFVNWQTSLPSSYWSHLTVVHKGHETPHWVTPLLSVAEVVIDGTRTLVESPLAAYLHYEDRYRSVAERKDLVRPFAGVTQQCPATLDFREGKLDPHRPSVKRDVLQSAIFFPATLIGSGLLDAVGGNAWGSMIYTSERLFYKKEELHHPYDYVPEVTGAGGFPLFLDALADVVDANDDITVVAHSAGAVVANKLIANYPDLPIHDLLYMAPACTIDELMAGGKLATWLGAKDGRSLYILALHEQSELEESHWGGLAPRGSLLVWLDEYIQPKSSEFGGAMLGRARNLRLHAHLIPCKIQEKVHITAFNDDRTKRPWEEPQQHGDFGRLPYWGRDWRQPRPPGVEPICLTTTPKTPTTCATRLPAAAAPATP